jgi:hypothetical protein
MMMSAVCGHTHELDFHSKGLNPRGECNMGAIVGCYLDPDNMNNDYAGPQGGTKWWNGLVWLNGVDGKGYFDLETQGINQVFKEYL